MSRLKTLTREDLLTAKGDLTGILRKASVGGIEVAEGEDRTLNFKLSTAAVDRDNDTIDQDGWLLDSYKANPVVLWAHDYSQPPVARALNIGRGVDNILRSPAKFADAETYPFADTVYRLLKGGFLNATSVGFAPKTYAINEERGGLDFKQQELLEFSIVPVPANPEALIEARSAGIDLRPVAKWAREIHKALNLPHLVDELWNDAHLAPAPKKTYFDVSVTPVQPNEPALKNKVTDQAGKKWVKVSEPGAKNRFFVPSEEFDELGDPIRWNRSLSKAFDVDGEPVEPSAKLYGWVSRYLDTPVKNLYETSVIYGGAKMGAQLVALEEQLADYKAESVRNLSGSTEAPPIYETIRLNSTKSQDFLTEGTRFLAPRKPGMNCGKFVLRSHTSWAGLIVTAFCAVEAKDQVLALFGAAHRRSQELNFLKGECFTLSGEFLQRGDTGWDDIFLAPAVTEPIRRTVQLINEHGKEADSRGVILMGPPGTGKTLVARAIMAQAPDATYISITARDFSRFGMFGGIEAAYELAKENAPCVLFMDDVDSWWSDHTVDLLKTTLDGVQQQKGITSILATNHPEQLPEALIDRPGRFHDVLTFSLPTETIRRQMLAKWAPDADHAVLDQLAKDTIEFSGAHLRDLVRYAETIRSQDGVSLEIALQQALAKVREQRETIDAARGRRRVRAVKMLTTKFLTFDARHDGDPEADFLATVAKAQDLHAQVKRGRVLSSANEGRVRQAKELLDEVLGQLAAADPEPGEEQGAPPPALTDKRASGVEASASEHVLVLDDEDEVDVLVLDKADDDLDISIDDVRAALRGAVASVVGAIVQEQAAAALNHALGRVD